MEQKSSAVKALTGGIAHLFKQNGVSDTVSSPLIAQFKNLCLVSPQWIKAEDTIDAPIFYLHPTWLKSSIDGTMKYSSNKHLFNLFWFNAIYFRYVHNWLSRVVITKNYIMLHMMDTRKRQYCSVKLVTVKQNRKTMSRRK